MAFVDLARGKLILKVVLAGPPAVGKTDRLDQIGEKGRREKFGSRVTGETQMAVLPLTAERDGREVEIEVYEWHGPEKADVRAKSLWVGLDGIVYIADAREDRCVDTARQFEFLVENAGKSKVQRLSGLLLLGRIDEGLLRLPYFEGKLTGPMWSEKLELPIEEKDRFVEAMRVYGEVMLARVL
jgi:hypothetical protein